MRSRTTASASSSTLGYGSEGDGNTDLKRWLRPRGHLSAICNSRDAAATTGVSVRT